MAASAATVPNVRAATTPRNSYRRRGEHEPTGRRTVHSVGAAADRSRRPRRASERTAASTRSSIRWPMPVSGGASHRPRPCCGRPGLARLALGEERRQRRRRHVQQETQQSQQTIMLARGDDGRRSPLALCPASRGAVHPGPGKAPERDISARSRTRRNLLGCCYGARHNNLCRSNNRARRIDFGGDSTVAISCRVS